MSIVALSIIVWVLKEQKDQKTATKNKPEPMKTMTTLDEVLEIPVSIALPLHFGTLYMQGRDCKAVPIHPGNGIVDLTDVSPIINNTDFLQW